MSDISVYNGEVKGHWTHVNMCQVTGGAQVAVFRRVMCQCHLRSVNIDGVYCVCVCVVCTHVCVYMYVCLRVHVYICVCSAHICVCMCMVYVCMDAYVCMLVGVCIK